MRSALVLFVVASAAADPHSADFTLPSGIKVEIIEAGFESAAHTILGCDGAMPVCRINGQVPMGPDNGIPQTYVQSITVAFEGQSYALDASNMYDAWGERPLEADGIARHFGGTCSDPYNCAFRGVFSDGAGVFAAEWHVVNGQARRTVLTKDEALIASFQQEIDPPESGN
jgi:hypothetical protein